MTPKAEVIYFIKPCPHCKEMLFRVEKMSMAWSECRNEKCPFIVNQVPTRPLPNRFPDLWDEPEAYTECFNRK